MAGRREVTEVDIYAKTNNSSRQHRVYCVLWVLGSEHSSHHTLARIASN